MTDEEQIRALVQKWMAATKAGDTQSVLELMTDDVVFLQPGRPPMRKAEFAAAQAGADRPAFDGRSDIQEVQVAGEWAFLWSRLEVVATPADGSPRMRRDGHTLTVLRKIGGKWLLARDANLLGPPRAL